MTWLLVISGLLGTGGAIFLGYLLYRAMEQLSSVKTELVVERQLRGTLESANQSLQNQLARDRVADKLPVPPVLAPNKATPKEAVDAMRNALAILAGLPSVPTTREDNSLLTGRGPVPPAPPPRGKK